MSWFKKPSACSSGVKRETIKLSKDGKKFYYISEFKSVGDKKGDNVLSYIEFSRLMTLLGYPGDLRKLWKSRGKPDSQGWMTMEEYCHMMTNKDIRYKTNQWRRLFAEFDHDASGTATKEQVLQGLEKIGLKVNDRLKDTVNKMAGEDGIVSYGDFLMEQLKQVV